MTGVVDIEAQRHHRTHAQVTNWPKDIRTELAQIIYEQPIYPKNIYADDIPGKHAEYKKAIIDRQVKLMLDRGVWKAPSGD